MSAVAARTSLRPSRPHLVAALLLILGLLAPAAAPTASAAGASLSGTVTDEQGQPIQGIVVWAESQLGANRTATTDSAGAYTITDLAVSRHRILFYDPAGRYLSEYYNNATGFFEATLVQVDAQDISGIDADMRRAYTISGTVTDEQGQPLDVISVELQSDRPHESQTTLSDPTGAYTFAKVGAGSYRVRFSDAHVRYQAEYYDNSGDAAGATPVVVTDQDVTSIDAALSDGVAVSGAVTDEQGRPLDGITVRLIVDYAGVKRTTRTDATGVYTFSGIWPGAYKVEFLDEAGGYLSEYYDDTTDHFAAQLVTVGSEDVAGIDASLRSAPLLGGVVTNQEGQPIPGILVEVRPIGGGRFFDLSTDTSGIYTATGILPGVYTVRFLDPSGTYLTAPYRSDPSSPDGSPVTLDYGERRTDIGAVLVRRALLSGTVTDAQGQPVVSLPVKLYVATGGGYALAGSEFTRHDGTYRFISLPAGDYKLMFEDPGPSFAHIYYPDAATLGAAMTVTLRAGQQREGLDVALPPAAHITGLVTAAATGQPAPVTVEVLANDGGVWVPVQSLYAHSGSYDVSNLAAGVYRLRFSSKAAGLSPEYYPNVATVEAAADVTLGWGQRLEGLDAALEPGGSISGAVSGAGAPVGAASVWLFTESNGQWTSSVFASLSPAGSYSFIGLQPGVYRVGVMGLPPSVNLISEFYDDAETIEAAADIVVSRAQALTGIDMDLARGGTISGVLRADGVRRAGVRVKAYRADGTQGAVASAVTDATGRYTLSRLRTGSYVVEFGADPWSGIYTPEFYLDAPERAGATAVGVTLGAETVAIDGNLAVQTGPDTPFVLQQPVGPTVVALGTSARYEASLAGGRNISLSWAVDGGPPTAGPALDVTFAAAGGHAVLLTASNGVLTQTTYLVVEVVGQDPPRGAIKGQARTSDSAPIEGVSVTAARVVHPLPPFAVAHTTTGGDGRYTLAELPAGQYLVSFFNPASYREQRYRKGDGGTSFTLVTVVGGATAEGVDAVFAPPAPPAALITARGVVTSDPETGLVTVTINRGGRSDLGVLKAVSCTSGTVPVAVTLWLGQQSYAMAESPAGSGMYATTIPAGDVTSAMLKVTFSCSGAEQAAPVGEVELFDPSGFIRDEVSGAPIEGAVVTLYSVPGYTPKLGPDDTAANTCETADTLGGHTWADLPEANKALGVVAAADPRLIAPQLNPQVTGSDGYYGWDVARGCWYVTVDAPGYARKVSAMAGVPPAVTDLDLYLTPLAPAATPSVSFAAATSSANEDAGVAVVSVTLSKPVGVPVSVSYRSTGGTAVAGASYRAALGTITFAPGETSRQIVLTLTNDELPCAARTVTLALSKPVGARLGERPTTTVTISDGDRYRTYLPQARR